MSEEPLHERKFSLPEVCVLMVLEMSKLDARDARESWTHCGAPVEVFDRIVKRLTDEGVLMTHPYRHDCTQTGKLYEALGDHYTNLLLQAPRPREAVTETGVSG